MHLDVDQYNMVKEALHERSNMLEVAPHLTHPLPIMLPVYQYVLALMECFFNQAFILPWIKELIRGSRKNCNQFFLIAFYVIDVFRII